MFVYFVLNNSFIFVYSVYIMRFLKKLRLLHSLRQSVRPVCSYAYSTEFIRFSYFW